ncbi:hypothetical protein NXS19_000627, partial [Fusarium pseudograminearum]
EMKCLILMERHERRSKSFDFTNHGTIQTHTKVKILFGVCAGSFPASSPRMFTDQPVSIRPSDVSFLKQTVVLTLLSDRDRNQLAASSHPATRRS